MPPPHTKRTSNVKIHGFAFSCFSGKKAKISVFLEKISKNYSLNFFTQTSFEMNIYMFFFKKRAKALILYFCVEIYNVLKFAHTFSEKNSKFWDESYDEYRTSSTKIKIQVLANHDKCLGYQGFLKNSFRLNFIARNKSALALSNRLCIHTCFSSRKTTWLYHSLSWI